jgi:UDP-N-acetylglucosamine 2-epimerase (non-hydrolysing)
VIAFVVGTTAELIKVAPVHHELVARGVRPLLWFTGWHVDDIPTTLAELDLPAPDVWLVPESGARNLERPLDVPAWAAGIARTVWQHRRQLAAALTADGCPPLVVVHGDTFTCPIGAFLGHRLGARVAHVEAGMRSGSLLAPFPEEANRRVAARLVDLHFAPTQREAHNLRKAHGAVVVTGANTVIDAVRFALERRPADASLPEKYGIVTLHRFELLQRQDAYTSVLRLLREQASQLPLRYLAGAPERERIQRWGLEELFDDAHFQLSPKLSYLQFLPVLAGAELVVTDSGGLQEEAAYLGLPCAIHRERTEQHRGLGQNIVLTGMDDDRLRDFLASYAQRRAPSMLDSFHPSRVIVDALAALGYLTAEA